MSRIGNKEIIIPAGVTVGVNGNVVDASGKLGSLRREFNPGISVRVEGNKVVVVRANDSKPMRAQHGLVRSLIANMVHGVSEGYSKKLTIKGVGYKAVKQGSKIVLSLGLSHTVEFEEKDGIKFEIPKLDEVVVKGIDKEKVGMVAADIRSAKPVEPYHLYGIKYEGEYVKKREGKTGKK